MKTGFCRVHDIMPEKYPSVLIRTEDTRYLHPHGIDHIDWDCWPTPRELAIFVWHRYIHSLWFRLRYR